MDAKGLLPPTEAAYFNSLKHNGNYKYHML
jgi:hypothetical protein